MRRLRLFALLLLFAGLLLLAFDWAGLPAVAEQQSIDHFPGAGLLDRAIVFLMTGSLLAVLLEKRDSLRSLPGVWSHMAMIPVLFVVTVASVLVDGVGQLPGLNELWAYLFTESPAGTAIMFSANPVTLWCLPHLLFLSLRSTASVPLSEAFDPDCNPWLLMMWIVIAFLLFLQFLAGHSVDFVALLLWLYFYLSLAAARIAVNRKRRKMAMKIS